MVQVCRIIVFVCLIVSLGSCIEKEINFDVLRASRDHSIEIATNVLIEYSDSARLRVKIEGPVLKRYIYRFRMEEEFPEGISVEFYDDFGRPNSWLIANYAIRKPNEKVVIARDEVVLFNDKGEKIESYELIWDESDRSLSTEHLVKITQPSGEVIWSRGFWTNESFTEYDMHAVEGEMTIDQMALDSKPKD